MRNVVKRILKISKMKSKKIFKKARKSFKKNKKKLVYYVNINKINSPNKVKRQWDKDHQRVFLKKYHRLFCSANESIAGADEYLDSQRELNEDLKQLIDPEKKAIKILDVGSGPVTRVGYKWGDRKIIINAIDVNADNYHAFFKESNIIVDHLCTPVKGSAEDLTAIYDNNSFDLIYSRNALDHCYDPLKAIKEMVKLIKPNCYIYLHHFRNEGEYHSYKNGHLWNCDVRDNKFTIHNPAINYDINNEFRYNCEVACKLIEGGRRHKIVACLLKKEH